MPRRPQNTATRGNTPADLERHLTLLAWLQSQLGYSDTVELLSDFKQLNEGFDDGGRSYACAHLKARTDRMPEITVTPTWNATTTTSAIIWPTMNAGRTRAYHAPLLPIPGRVVRRNLP